MKILVNECYGGFGLSEEAQKLYEKRTGKELDSDVNRTDTDLIAIVEELGKDASDEYADIMVEEIPDNATDWDIDEYDGLETIWYVQDGHIYYND